MKLPELSDATGVSPRNIKRYIHERLLAPPDGRTRSARYSDLHRRALLRIESLRAAGLSMEEIRRELQPSRAPEDDLAVNHAAVDELPLVEHRYLLAEGVFVVFTSRAATQDPKDQAAFVTRCRAMLPT